MGVAHMNRPQIFILLSLLIPSILFSQKQLTKTFENETQEVIRLTFNSEFDRALALCNEHLSVDPNSLEWKYFRAMIFFQQSIYLGNYINLLESTNNESEAKLLLEKSFSELQEISQMGEDLIQKNPSDTLALFFTGAAYGYIGMYYADKDEIFTAASQGKKGIEYHEKLIKLCPSWNDVYYSRAIFHFYTSMVPWYLKPILWILGNLGTESEAELYLKKVSDCGFYAKYAALEKLGNLYARQKKYDEQYDITIRLVNELPENKYMYLLKHAWFSKNLNNSMRACNRGIELSKVENLSQRNIIEVAHLYLTLASCYEKSEKYTLGISVLEELLNRKLNPAFDSWTILKIGDLYADLGKKNEASEKYNWVISKSKIEKHKSMAKEKLTELNAK